MICKPVFKSAVLAFLFIFLPVISQMAAAEERAGVNYYIDGTEAYDAGSYKTALMFLGKAIELEPFNLDYQYYYAMIYKSLGRYQEAESIYRAILKIDEKNYYKAWFDLADIYTEQKDYKKAFEAIGSAESGSPDNPEIYLEKGSICRRMKDYNAAIENFNRALELDSKLSQEINYKLGLVYYNKKQYSTAKNLFEMAAIEKPDKQIAENSRRAIEAINSAIRSARPWSLFAYLSYSYDDNLSEDPLDLPGHMSSSASDREGQYQVLFLKGDYRFLEANRFRMYAGYQFTLINFNDSENENCIENSPFLAMKYSLNPCYFKLAYNYAHYLADGDERQIQHRIKPSVTILEPGNMKSVIKFMYKIKDYEDDAPSEDTNVWTAELIQYFSVPSLKMTPRIGFKYGDEDSDSEADTYTYFETMAGVKIELPYELAWDLSFTDIRSDYDIVIGGENREDTGYLIETFLRKEISSRLSAKLYYGYTHNKSNVTLSGASPAAYSYDPYKYDKNHVRLSFSMNF